MITSWIIALFMLNKPVLKAYEINCGYNDKKIKINFTLEGEFTPLEANETFKGVCGALKAFRECKYLRTKYPHSKRIGTNIVLSNKLWITKDPNLDTDNCGYTRRNGEGHIYLTPYFTDSVKCDTPTQVIFHELLHNSSMPDHDLINGSANDPIYKTVYACVK